MTDTVKSNSPKTTGGAIVVLLMAIIAIVKPFVDGDPTTSLTPDLVMAAVGAGGTAFALWKARDHDVTSEAAGAK